MKCRNVKTTACATHWCFSTLPRSAPLQPCPLFLTSGSSDRRYSFTRALLSFMFLRYSPARSSAVGFFFSLFTRPWCAAAHVRPR